MPILIPMDELEWADRLAEEADRLEETGEEIKEIPEKEENAIVN